jgi:hypothetical protein
MDKELNPIIKQMIEWDHLSIGEIRESISHWTSQKEKAERSINQFEMAEKYWKEVNNGKEK